MIKEYALTVTGSTNQEKEDTQELIEKFKKMFDRLNIIVLEVDEGSHDTINPKSKNEHLFAITFKIQAEKEKLEIFCNFLRDKRSYLTKYEELH